MIKSVFAFACYIKNRFYTLYSLQIFERFDSARLKFKVVFNAKREDEFLAMIPHSFVFFFVFVFLSRLVARLLKHLYAIRTCIRTHAYINTGQRWLASQLVNLFWISVSLHFFSAFISFRFVSSITF